MSSISLVSRLVDFIAPRRCAMCGRRLAVSENVICNVCQFHLPRTLYSATPYDNEMARLFYYLMPIERAAAWFFYEPASAPGNIIYRLKYGGQMYTGSDIGAMMAQEMAVDNFFDGIDIIVPVPLSKRRYRERGYNQSREIARGVSRVTGLPLAGNIITRRYTGLNNVSLHGRWWRAENVDGVFSLTDPSTLHGKHILIVDDVVTTGATILSLCTEIMSHAAGVRFSVLSIGFTKV